MCFTPCLILQISKSIVCNLKLNLSFLSCAFLLLYPLLLSHFKRASDGQWWQKEVHYLWAMNSIAIFDIYNKHYESHHHMIQTLAKWELFTSANTWWFKSCFISFYIGFQLPIYNLIKIWRIHLVELQWHTLVHENHYPSLQVDSFPSAAESIQQKQSCFNQIYKQHVQCLTSI